MDPLILAVGQMVHELRAARPVDSAPVQQVFTYDRPDDEDLVIESTGPHEYAVHGRAFERWVIQTEIANDEAVAFLQRRLARAGVERALEQAGARDGDSVTIGPITFEFESGLAEDE
jgi:GTP-binding protein